jgi:GNAT superfamily N-acetyltransferase
MGGEDMMDVSRLAVRRATLDDVIGIRGIHSDCDDPWSHPGSGPVWINHRLLRGFQIDVATLGDTVVGHAEWNVSDEPAPYGRYLYLGMLQVHREYQRQGVGQAMVEAGVARARSLPCDLVKTIPEPEACGFYVKCGFEPISSITAVDLEVVSRDLPDGWSRARCVPQGVVASLPFRLGWSGQASSAFMWEMCNRPIRVVGEEEQHPCAQLHSGQAYVQLRYVGGHGALAVAWADNGVPLKELSNVAQSLAGLLSIDSVTISVADTESDELAKMSTGVPLRTAEIWARKV